MNFNNQRILVIGGAGFIGSHLVDQLVSENPKEIHVVDSLFLGSEENLVEARSRYPKLHFHKFDATKGSTLRKLIRKEKITLVFNLATKALGYSFDNPEDAFHVNVQIASHLMESLRLGELQRLIHFSSSEAYGTALQVPIREDHLLVPHTPYAAGKAAADLLIGSYQKSFGLRVLILRPFNNYGPRQNMGIYAGVIPFTIRRLLDGQPPLIQGNGLQTRDFMYVGDTARLALALVKKEDLGGVIINLGTGTETTICDVVKSLCRISGYNGEVVYASSRAGDVSRHCADIKVLKSLMDGLSLKTLEEGLIETWEWYNR